ncbi:MAG: asparaginase [Chloroflexi bacterium]|jgi:L-asparaginase II|nr:asparaginase [Chloroflexota bacterium]
MDVCSGYEPLVELTRGGIVESIHLGALAAVDSDGILLAAFGNSDMVSFPRSSMKPFQALPLVENGGMEAFGLTDEELAIICASHAGTNEHVRVLKSIHQKVGLQLSDLQCGVHWPIDKETAFQMRLLGETPDSYRHNCSGKHSGMLTQAKLLEQSLDDYLTPVHLVQQNIRRAVSSMCGIHRDDMIFGVDGCSAPVYAMPLSSFAWAIARLVDPVNLDEERQIACQRITSAMIAYPEMVAGPGQLDSVLMQVMNGKVIAKGGAEGYQLIGVMPGAIAENSKGIGIAFKIADGDPSRRATQRIVVEMLKALGFEAEMASEAFASFNQPILRNFRGIEIGNIRLARPIQFFS